MAYYDSKQDRVLLRNGVSVVSPFRYAQLLLEGNTKGFCALSSFDSVTYDVLYQEDITHDIEDIEVEPTISHDANEDEVETLISEILSSPRLSNNPAYINRVDVELEFFQRTKNIVFLIKCNELVKNMKSGGDVWGVGRGSSCASLILYLLGVTDIDPVKYNIPFHELSKEMEDKYA